MYVPLSHTHSALQIVHNASQFNRLYVSNIVTKQLRLIRRHRTSLLGDSPCHKLKDPSRRNSDITHSGHDCNGFSLDPDKITSPDEEMLWTAKSPQEFDEYYTRRVMGFESVGDMWQWMSCVDLMYRITDFPLLLVNAHDDPLVPAELHSIPIQYTGMETCINGQSTL